MLMDESLISHSMVVPILESLSKLMALPFISLGIFGFRRLVGEHLEIDELERHISS